MFRKLGKKYNVPSPLDSAEKMPAFAPFGASPSPLQPAGSVPLMPVSSNSSGAPSAFGSTTGLVKSASPRAAPSPFSSTIAKSTMGNPPFGQTSSTTTSPFGARTPSSPSPFGQQSSEPLSFGNASPATPLMTSSTLIGGREPREVLLAFYQKYNPSKVGEIDKLLAKYKNNEEQLFRNLANKYNLDPTIFGLAPKPSIGPLASGSAQGGFGQAAPVFGTGSTASASTFGASSSSSFGQHLSLGSSQPAASGFGQNAIATGGHAFGASSAVGSGQATFGSLASSGSSASPFGGGANQSGFGSASGFGSMSGGFGGGASNIGGAAPFGGPRR